MAKKRVNQKVTNLVLKREGNSFKATWKIPSAMKKASDDHCADHVECELDFRVSKDKKSGEVWYGSASHANGMSYTGFDDVTIKGLGLSTTVTKSYGRSRFHPLTKGRTLSTVRACVWGVNSPGEWMKEKDGDRWWWKRYDGSYPVSMWEYIDKKWYLFDSAGWMRYGTVTWHGQSYTLGGKDDGHLISSGKSGTWIKDNNSGKWWYRHTDGTCTKKDWEYIKGQWYLFDANGWMRTGTVKFQGSVYRLASDGHYIPPSGEVAGPGVYTEYKFSKPKEPSVSWSYNQDNAVATLTVTTDEGKGNRERYDTMVMVKVKKPNGSTETLQEWKSTPSTKYTQPFDLSKYLTDLQKGKSVTIMAWAYARGIAGDNPSAANAKYKERSVVFPLAGTVGTPVCDKKAATGRIKVPVSSNSITKQLQLQRSHDGESWTDVSGATDNQNAKALYDSYGDANPQPGEYTYYRIKATRDNFTDYSEMVRADCIYTEPPKETCSATCKLVSLASNAAGNQITVVMAWKDSTTNDGSELSWSEYDNGWNTSEKPSSELLADKGTGAIVPDNPTKLKGWKTKTFSISGLTSGKTYYIRERRYKVYDSGTKYSEYDKKGVATAVKTESAGDDDCGIAEVAVNGTTATITVGINEDNVNAGTEITWATHEDAWQSNEQPESFNAEWARSSYGQEGWTYKQVIYLRGLEPGRTYYAKARRYDSEGIFSAYSKVKPFTIPSGAAEKDYDVRCGLISVEPGDDGHSAKVVIGWSGDHTGCEVTWSDNPDAWESSDGPSSFEFEWSDAERKSEDWAYTSTCYITGLDEGVTYYVKARSYFDGDPKTYSSYTDDMIVTPYAAPESVALDAPAAIARGSAIECWWEISGELPQVEWHMHDEDSPLTAIAEGTGTLCHSSIDPERYGDAESISFYVEAGCGGGLTRSNTVTVGIADKPECEAYCANLLTAQPASFEVITNDAGARLLATCYSHGCTLSAPDGDYDQLDGDTVWTQALTPSWESVRWDETSLYTALSADVASASAAVTAAQTAFEATEEYATMDSAEDDSDAAALALASAQSDFDDASAALTAAQNALASAEAALAAAQAVLDELEPGDPGYDEALAAVDAAQADVEDAEDSVEAAQGDYDDAQDALDAADDDYRDALAAYLAAYDAAYATPEGVALQDANAASDDATAALGAHDASDELYSATVTMPVSELYDGGAYYCEFKTVENVAGLASDTATVEFAVAYAHQAPDPSVGVYSLTADTAIEIGKTYYEQGTEYDYVRTEDTDVDAGKTYYEYDDAEEEYTVVDDPTAEGLPDYFERTETTVYIPVEEPVAADIATYYEYNGITISIDENGRKAMITLMPPAGSASTDSIDIYRQTPAGYELVAESLQLTASSEDLYAPYGKANTAYRIACKTADGDIAWAEFPYSMPVGVIRFDWDGNSIELPWNIEIREQSSKDYEERSHVNGSVNGYWDRGVRFSGSYSTDIIKVQDADLLRQVRSVGEYPGAIWVRDGYGKAMQCNVDVNETGISYNSKAVGLSFGFSAMKTTAQFMPTKEASNG